MMDCTLRPVRSLEELEWVFDILGRQFATPFTHQHRRFADLAQRYPQDRPLMVLAERDHGGDVTIVGGALAFRAAEGSPGATIRLVAVVEAHRGMGLGRRLLEHIEAEAVRLGVDTVFLGAGADVRGFYLKLGYSGRSRLSKALPGSAAERCAQADGRRAALEALRSRRAQRQANKSKQASPGKPERAGT